MTAPRQILFWSLAFAGFIVFVYAFKSILLPFVLGAAVAYLLNPLVNALGRVHMPRKIAALLILLCFLLIVFVAFAALVPFATRELVDFSNDLPGYINQLVALAQPVIQSVQQVAGIQDSAEVKTMLGEHAGSAARIATQVLGGLAAGGQGALHFISVLVIMPIVAYFMMKEWVYIANWTEDLMPREHKSEIKGLLKDIDARLSGFVRGQFGVAMILGIFYALALSLVGLKYGFLVGLSAGLLSIIPMVGSTVGLVVGIALAWFDTGEWSFVALVAGIFLAGQFVEGNFLTPKLVGGSVGLHPLWIFFALMAGGSLFGILGMLLAVPVAAVAGVLAAFAIRRYKASAYYKGTKK